MDNAAAPFIVTNDIDVMDSNRTLFSLAVRSVASLIITLSHFAECCEKKTIWTHRDALMIDDY